LKPGPKSGPRIHRSKVVFNTTGARTIRRSGTTWVAWTGAGSLIHRVGLLHEIDRVGHLIVIPITGLRRETMYISIHAKPFERTALNSRHNLFPDLHISFPARYRLMLSTYSYQKAGNLSRRQRTKPEVSSISNAVSVGFGDRNRQAFHIRELRVRTVGVKC